MLRRFLALRRITKVVVGFVVFVTVALGCGYGFLIYTTHDAPPPAHLARAGRLVPQPPTRLDGTWRVLHDGQGFAGYRVREQFVGLPAPDDAVGRTKAVTGSLTIAGSILREAELSADMQQLKSDQPPRDGQLQTVGPQTATYPRAGFFLDRPVALPKPRVGKVFRFAVHGKLTIHGVTRPVAFPLEARWTGRLFQVAGGLRIVLADYNMSIGSQMGMDVSRYGTVEVQLDFAKAGTSPKPPPATKPTQPAFKLERPAANLGTIVFQGRQNDHVALLYRARTDGSKVRPLTKRPQSFGVEDAQPTVSPDGSHVVFVRKTFPQDSDPNPDQLYEIGADGGPIMRLSQGPDANHFPAFSPDGRQIAFVRTDASNESTLLIMNADGTHIRSLATPNLNPSSPAWSPDGEQLAFVGSSGSQDLYLINADGSHLRRITSGAAYDYAPWFSPDGRRVVFGRDGHLYRVDLYGTGQLIQLTGGSYRDATPHFSRDGRYILFSRSDERGRTFAGKSRLVLIPASGGRPRRVPLEGGNATWPAWLG
jgi:Tol biopolymer transport system component/polyisoprenoid-binding protein YceI